MSARTKIIGLVTLVGAASALIWAFAPQPFPAEVVEVQRGRFEQTIEDDGKTRVRERYIVSAPIAGRMNGWKSIPEIPCDAAK